MSSLTLANWNVEWARPGSRRGDMVCEILRELDADLICVTEGFRSTLPSPGYVLESAEDYGYPIHAGRRKVLLWSVSPWREADCVGNERLPGGRFASGVTDTPLGPVAVLGVCIPWRAAHVSTGRRDRQVWQDHSAYLTALPDLLQQRGTDIPRIMVGDFNQRVPRKRSPEAVYALLESATTHLSLATAGVIPGIDAQVVNHVAHSADLQVTKVSAWPNVTETGMRLSDHPGVVVELTEA